jgi:hypothetical protein
VASLAAIERVLDLDETRSSKSKVGNGVRSGDVVGSSQSSVGEALSDQLVVGELSLKSDSLAIPLNILSLDTVGKLLASCVGDVEILVLVRLLKSSFEREALVLSIKNSNGTTVDQQRREDGKVDLLDVLSTRARNNEALESRPGKSSRDSGQER